MVRRKLNTDLISLSDTTKVYEKDTIVDLEVIKYAEEFVGKVSAKLIMPGGEILWVDESLLGKP